MSFTCCDLSGSMRCTHRIGHYTCYTIWGPCQTRHDVLRAQATIQLKLTQQVSLTSIHRPLAMLKSLAMPWRNPTPVLCQHPIQIVGATPTMHVLCPCSDAFVVLCLLCPVCSSPRGTVIRPPCRAIVNSIARGRAGPSCGRVVAKQSAFQSMVHLLQICIGLLQLLQVRLETLCSGLRRCVLTKQLLPLGLVHSTLLHIHSVRLIAHSKFSICPTNFPSIGTVPALALYQYVMHKTFHK